MKIEIKKGFFDNGKLSYSLSYYTIGGYHVWHGLYESYNIHGTFEEKVFFKNDIIIGLGLNIWKR